jgi:hypothetical protein
MYGHQVEQLTVKNCPLCNATSPQLLRAYFIASMPKLISFNDVGVSAEDRRVAESLYTPLIRMQQICLPAQSPAVAVAAVPSGSSSGAKGALPRQGQQQQSLLRAHQSQTTRQLMQSFYMGGGSEPDLQSQGVEQGPAANTGSVTAEMLSSMGHMGSFSPWDQQGAQQSGAAGAEAGVAASGLSARALHRRRISQAFDTAFDSAVLKVLHETLAEMKQQQR